MRMRYLKSNKRTSLPQEVCFLGVAGHREHVSGSKTHDMVYFDSVDARFMRQTEVGMSRKHHLSSASPMAFWTYLDNRCSRSRPVMVYCYDVTECVTLLGFWRLLDLGIYHRGTIIDADPPVIINAFSLSGRICFVDVRNYFEESIDDLGRSFGVKHVDVGLDLVQEGYQYVEASWRATVAEVSMCALMHFVREHDCGRFKSTIAMQAMQSFRHRFAPRNTTVAFGQDSDNPCKPTEVTKVFPLMHDDLKIKAFERKANYSGHDECFFVGSVIPASSFFGPEPDYPFKRNGHWIYGPVYHVDANSLFPYVMKHCRYPCRYVGQRDYASVSHLEKLLGKYAVIARVLLDTNHDTFPVRRKDRVLYCTGQFWTTLAAKELEYAWRRGYITKVGYHVCYDTMDLFSSYVDYFYKLKCEYKAAKNQSMALITKGMLNTLQGKFSQRQHKWEDRPHVKPLYRWGKWMNVDYDAVTRNEELVARQRRGEIEEIEKEQEVFHFRSIAEQTQLEIVSDECGNSMPAIGACVTANARNMMAGVRELCGRPNVLYQGTDSLLLLEPGYQKMLDAGLIHDTDLGAFRLKGVYDYVKIRTTQDYQLSRERVTRGLPKRARCVSGEAYTFDVRQSLSGMLFSCPAKQIAYTNVTRTFGRSYDGGRVGKNGWVTPYHLTYDGGRGDAWEDDSIIERATNETC